MFALRFQINGKKPTRSWPWTDSKYQLHIPTFVCESDGQLAVFEMPDSTPRHCMQGLSLRFGVPTVVHVGHTAVVEACHHVEHSQAVFFTCHPAGETHIRFHSLCGHILRLDSSSSTGMVVDGCEWLWMVAGQVYVILGPSRTFKLPFLQWEIPWWLWGTLVQQT